AGEVVAERLAPQVLHVLDAVALAERGPEHAVGEAVEDVGVVCERSGKRGLARARWPVQRDGRERRGGPLDEQPLHGVELGARHEKGRQVEGEVRGRRVLWPGGRLEIKWGGFSGLRAPRLVAHGLRSSAALPGEGHPAGISNRHQYSISSGRAHRPPGHSLPGYVQSSVDTDDGRRQSSRRRRTNAQRWLSPQGTIIRSPRIYSR